MGKGRAQAVGEEGFGSESAHQFSSITIFVDLISYES
jgi:hypothetical protein